LVLTVGSVVSNPYWPAGLPSGSWLPAHLLGKVTKAGLIYLINTAMILATLLMFPYSVLGGVFELASTKTPNEMLSDVSSYTLAGSILLAQLTGSGTIFS
jgi:hypothetical protein